MEEIGFLWTGADMDRKDRHWVVMFEELKEYKATHGHCKVPIKEGTLGRWVKTQRRMYTTGNLRRDRQEMLESVGFIWRLKSFSPKDNPEQKALWDSQFSALSKFKDEHGHTRVPCRGYLENRELGIWVHNQRRRNKEGTLRLDRKGKLDKIGFTWDCDEIYEESWLENYEQLKHCYAKKLAMGKPIRWWAKNQRTFCANGSLEPERKALLDEIGFEWWERPEAEHMDEDYGDNVTKT
ncbi:helicase [Seminavis robusta]|uniref:Helicase n=1 Tax=Seminavis robusta TaxID=568900 RepID=A0A9N8HID5_9STRA|nr:helicase [Seminavis robusta]|eukprot:Sro493_g154140.1 helicase (238) ;mRNA; f:43381-44094